MQMQVDKYRDSTLANTTPVERVKQRSSAVSFQENNFKCLRVFERIFHSQIALISYRILSSACQSMQLPSLSKKYGWLADNYNLKVRTTVLAYRRYGNRLINFGVNFANSHSNCTSPQGDPFDNCTKIYGNRFVDWFNRANAEGIPINKARLGLRKDGLCLGISLHYTSLYLQELAKGTDELEAIKSVSQLFSEQATVDAQMTHILCWAQEMSETLVAEIEKKYNDSDRDPFESIGLIEQMKIANVLKNYSMQIYFKKHFRDEPNSENLKRYLQMVKPGSYLITTDSDESGHATVFIKAKNSKCYRHNPTFGSFEISPTEAARTLHLEGNLLYLFELVPKLG